VTPLKNGIAELYLVEILIVVSDVRELLRGLTELEGYVENCYVELRGACGATITWSSGELCVLRPRRGFTEICEGACLSGLVFLFRATKL
jgi:hypothetical protein